MTRVKPAAAAGMAAAALLALPLGAFARHPHHARRSPSAMGTQQVQGTQVKEPGNTPWTLSSLTAGTVTSFANSVLTVTLNDGQVLTGTVDRRTKIVCGTPPPVRPRPTPPPGGDKPPVGATGAQGDQPSSGDPGAHFGSPRSVEPGSLPAPPVGATGTTGPQGPPGKGPGPNIHPCGPEALTPPTLIHAVGLMAEPRGVHYIGLALIKPAPVVSQ